MHPRFQRFSLPPPTRICGSISEQSGQISNAAIKTSRQSLDIFDQVSQVDVPIDLWNFHSGSNQVWTRRGATLQSSLGTALCLGYPGCESKRAAGEEVATGSMSMPAPSLPSVVERSENDAGESLASVTGASASNATCWSGKLEGGDLYTANMTVAQATAWCKAPKSKCAGFSALASYPDSCSSNTVLLIHFKDAWGANRMDASKTWTTWLTPDPLPQEYHCEGAQCVPGPARVNYYDTHCLGLCE